MADKLDFSLPDKRKDGSLTGGLTTVLLLIVAVLAAANLIVTLKGPSTASRPQADKTLSADQIRQLAAKLAQRNLYVQAADLWRDYLASAKLTAGEQAKTLFQIASMYKKADLHAQAIEYYYRSELAAKLSDLEPQINAGVKECFEKLGRFSAMRYELLDRTSYDKTEQAGGRIVAEIGPQKITEADLDAAIEKAIENQLAPTAAFMTEEQLTEQKKQMLGQYTAPQAKLQFLQGWLAEEVLYREALSQSLAEKAEVKAIVEDVTRKILSSQLITGQLASKINITETDLQTYFQAHQGEYVEPATARISHIRVAEESQALDIFNRLSNGEDFAQLAKEFSTDDATKEDAGLIDTPVTQGGPVPVIGDAEGLNDQIFAADANSILEKPIQTDNGWEIVKVLDKQPERQKSFDEVRREIMMTLSDRKRTDVQQAYIKQVMDEHNVIIHTSALTPPKPEIPAGTQK